MNLSSYLKMNARGWQAIVFDLDDTLYPERDYVLSGFRAVADWSATHLGIPADQAFVELTRLFEQGVRGDTFNRWLANYDLHEYGLVQKLVQTYREHQPTLRPFPDVSELLDALRVRYRLGLLSDGYLSVQQRKLDALGLADRFDAIVFSDEWGRAAWKPSPQPFQVILERLKAEPARVIYIADNPLKDFLGAREVGLFTIRAQWANGEYTHLDPPTEQYASDLTFQSIEELFEFFNRSPEKIR